jgi:molybdate transport system ATP-binding protein
MANSNHLAVFLNNNSNKLNFINTIFQKKAIGKLAFLNDLEGTLFSELSLNKFIETESRFGNSNLTKPENRDISTFSGGEQKKALLKYCLSKNTDYIILDNPFDNLDLKSQADLAELFKNIGDKIIIQIINRNKDLLPFIENAVSIDEDNKLVFYENVGNYLKENSKETNIYLAKIPSANQVQNAEFEEIICFKNVSVIYNGKPIITDINWTIKKGEFWQLVGPNGAGKTTLLSMIIGDNPKAYGQNISLFGHKKGSGESVADLKKNIGYFTPSMTNLFARTTSVEHMIVSGIFDSIGLYSIPSERHLRLANEWLNVLNMKQLAKIKFHKLTIGQQRIIMIARAMIKHPLLLILDEPTSGLDDHNALLVTTLINKIAQESTTAIIYVSHRKEAGLEPGLVYELTANDSGSTGKIKHD